MACAGDGDGVAVMAGCFVGVGEGDGLVGGVGETVGLGLIVGVGETVGLG